MIKTFFSIFSESSRSFEGQEEGEEVIMLLRRHPFFVTMRLSIYGLGALVPIFVGLTFIDKLLANHLLLVFMALAGIWQLLIWLGIFYTLTMYTLDVVIVTNFRIIDSEQHGLFNRKISELHIERVQDISVETKGLFVTMLHIGDIIVQTAGSEMHFIFHQIPDPERVKDAIMNIASVKSSDRI